MNASTIVKTIAAVALASAALVALAGCGSNAAAGDEKTIVVGASPTPHAEILEQVKDRLADEGYTLEVKEFTDYVQPNTALEDGALDANYFQHITYLEDFNDERGTNLASAGGIHFEPLCLYPGKTASLDALPDGAQIAVPSDTTNEARALLLLESQGLIKIRDGAGLAATANDIVENPKNHDRRDGGRVAAAHAAGRRPGGDQRQLRHRRGTRARDGARQRGRELRSGRQVRERGGRPRGRRVFREDQGPRERAAKRRGEAVHRGHVRRGRHPVVLSAPRETQPKHRRV